MRRFPCRKIIAFICSMVIVISMLSINNMTVLAEESTIDAFISETTTDEDIIEESSTETISSEETPDQENTLDTETYEEEETLLEESTTEEIMTEELEKAEDVVLAKEVNGIVIKASAKAGVLPDDATLDIHEINTTNKMEESVDEVISSEVSEDAQVDSIFSYDITILSNGEPVQPSEGTVNISFEGIEVMDDQVATVIYTSDDSSVVQTQDTEISDNGVSFEAEHFSIYNVVLSSMNTNKLNSEQDSIVTFVPQMGHTYLDVKSYVGADYQIKVSDSHTVDAYKLGDKLVISANETNDNKTVTVSVIGVSKTLNIEAHITGKPAKTSEEFVQMMYSRIGTTQKGDVTGNKYIQEFFNKKINTIDSTSVTGPRVNAIRSILGEDNLKGYSYAWYRLEPNTENEKMVLLYIPIDFSNEVIGDVSKFSESLNKVNQFYAVDCYTNDGMTKEQVMLRLKVNTLDGISYAIFNINPVTIDGCNNPTSKIQEKLKVTYEVADAYKTDYDLTGNNYSGDICSKIYDSNKVNGFGAVLQNNQNQRLDGVIMTLANDVEGTHNGQIFHYSAGTQISNLKYTANGTLCAFVVYNDSSSEGNQFGFVEFAEGTELHIYVSPVFFNINVYDTLGNIDTLKSGKVECQQSFTIPSDAEKTEDETYTYQFMGYSRTLDGQILSNNDLKTLLNKVSDNINLYPVFQSTRKNISGSTSSDTDIASGITAIEDRSPITTPQMMNVQMVNTPNTVNRPAVQSNQNNVAQNVGNIQKINDETVPLNSLVNDSNADNVKSITDNETPLAMPITKACGMHWYLLIITLLYSTYFLSRIYFRKREHCE